MEKGSDIRFLRWALPAATAVFLATAALLWYWPDIRASLAWRALEAGDYARARAWVEAQETERDRALYADACFAEACALEDAGRYAEAREAFAALPDLPESAAHVRACDYALALRAYDAGDYTAALETLTRLDGYAESLAYAERCRFALAEAAYAAGKSAQAVNLLLEIGTEEAERRAGEIAMEITGLPTAQEALLAAQGIDEAALAHWDALRARRESLPAGVLAVGFSHTLGLRADGTAVAAGDNGCGQCDVADWSGLTMVAAGARHSVGLRANGTVVAVGDNRFGQCDVADWRGVVRIVAGDFDTFALTEDGTVLTTGFHTYAGVAEWPNDVVRLAAGGHVLAAVRENGTMLASHASSRADAFANLADVAVQAGFAVGLGTDGTVSAVGFEAPEEWADVVAVSASATRVLALTADGAVLEHAFQTRDALALPAIDDAVAVAAGGTHAAVLHADGTVTCYGDNAAGACDTNDWLLRVSP